MATPLGRFRRQPTPRSRMRVLTASGAQINTADTKTLMALAKYRSGWQNEAFVYLDNLPELSYADRYSKMICGRANLYAGWINNPDDHPIHLEGSSCPAQYVPVAQQALDDLRGSNPGWSNVIGPVVSAFGTPGECWALGQFDGRAWQWSVKSIDEIALTPKGPILLDTPWLSAQSGVPAGVNLSDPDQFYLARMWTSHPRYTQLASSPMRAILSDCEEVMLLSKMIRSTVRSRIATAGILGLPDSLSFGGDDFDASEEDPEADPFMARFVQGAITALSDEGSAANAIPMVIRGDAADIKAMSHLVLDRPIDGQILAMRDSALGRIATGLDLPKEQLEGVADINHWGAAQVDDNTIAYFVEPKLMDVCEAWNGAYYKAALLAAGVPQTVADRMCIWYDVSPLKIAPDPMPNALNLWDRFALSDEALRAVAGFADADAPPDLEIVQRLITHSRSFPPEVVDPIVQRLDPSLNIQIAAPVSGTDTKATDAIEGVPAKPAGPPPTTPPAAGQAGSPAPASRTASGAPARRVDRAGSARLARIDPALRSGLHAAAETALARQMERAANKARGRASDAQRAAWKGLPALMVVGQATALRASAGDSGGLLDDDYDLLGEQFDRQTSRAQEQATVAAGKIVAGAITTSRLARARKQQETDRRAARKHLLDGVKATAEALALAAVAAQSPSDLPSLTVKVGLIRQVIAVAAGVLSQPGWPGFRTGNAQQSGAPGVPAEPSDGDLSPTARPMADDSLDADGQPLPGIAAGPTVGGILTDGGALQAGYTWEYGGSARPFEPHQDLDGVEFGGWDSSEVANDSGFPEFPFYFPGDHDGCNCSSSLSWSVPDDASSITDAGSTPLPAMSSGE